MTHRSTVRAWLLLATVSSMVGCGATTVTDPHKTLATVPATPARQIAAMEMLDVAPDDETYRKQLHRMLYAPYYTPDVREQAFLRLERWDTEGLKRTIREQMPRFDHGMYNWTSRLSELIAQRDWKDLTPALVRCWANPTPIRDDDNRAERHAIAAMYGEDQVVDVVFDMFVESDSVIHQGLRTRCWELLHRLGSRDRLIRLVADVSSDARDAMLLDLNAGAAELGLVPWNREEILWLRSLRKPENAGFWSEAVQATQAMTPQRRAAMELRDLPVAVAALHHDPELLTIPEHVLYERLSAALRTVRHFSHASQLYEGGQSPSDRLADHRATLEWGDLAAMSLARRAMIVPDVAGHLFDYAARDREDKSTEYGGVIELDSQGRFEVLEFPTVSSMNDHEFVASQTMLNSAYTSLFHFHFHVQRERNQRYAGPGPGDHAYANSVRANCLVLTSVGPNSMNVDFYRHGRVTVDLGEVTRP